MRIQAEISLYPLRTRELSPPIRRFREILATPGLQVTEGPMSTILGGDRKDVFRLLEEAFAAVAGEDEVVLICKISNACPEAPGEICRL
ncbi:MAG: thiamine-binding protein [Deltaproteobacteria bacterium]|nr:thiamine-binding protein [Deltaproteobacteria bacterium]